MHIEARIDSIGPRKGKLQLGGWGSTVTAPWEQVKFYSSGWF